MACFTKKEVNNPDFPELSGEVKRLKTTKGGMDAMCKVMEEYEKKAVIAMLLELIRDGILTEKEAADRMKMEESDFHKAAELFAV